MMRWIVPLLLGWLSGLLPSYAQSIQPNCSPDILTPAACPVENGRYIAIPPPGWDGATPLPVLFHFHGFRESAADMAANADIRAFGARHSVLLVFPDGVNGTWVYPGSPSKARDDFAYIDAVLKDVKARHAIAPGQVLASGFSQGGSMVWSLACYHPGRFDAYLTIAGTLWSPHPEACPPANILHIHGISDAQVPMAGRFLRNNAFHQGDVHHAVGLMRKANACMPEASKSERRGALTCEVMGGCMAGTALQLCLHIGGHDFDPAWLEEGLRLLPAAKP
jgi:polyhydroxybutyrate depolymerase